MKKAIYSDKAPKPIGPYSQAIRIRGLLFVSGQIPMDAKSGELIQTNISEETKKCMENIGHILQEAGMGFDNVVKASIFVKDMKKFGEVNAVYAEFFEGMIPPARETVQVSELPLSVNVEISVIAAE